MPNWWDNGLNSKDGTSIMVCSNGVQMKGNEQVGYTPDVVGAITVGSFSLAETLEDGYTYRRLINTLPSGTQIYLRLTTSTSNGTVYNPTESALFVTHTIEIELYKDGTSVSFTGGGGIQTTVIAGDMSIYNYIMRRNPSPPFNSDGTVIGSASLAFPKSRASGGSTNQIGMVASDDGLYFYLLGYSCVATQYNILFDCPGSPIGRIPTSALNNTLWFNPAIDKITDAEKSLIGGYEPGSGNRPIDYDYPGTDIDFPSLPSGASVMGFGRMNIFHPTASALAGALDILWSDTDESTLETIVESCKKWWYKPEQYCVSLMLMPVNVSGTQKKIYFGKYDTLQLAPAIDTQWVITDCGSLQIPLKSGSSFDFAPHVKAMIYLPYVGFRPINVNEIMGGTIAVKYYTDMYTGSSLCMVRIANQNSNTSVLYEYECNIAQQIPITSENYSNVINSVITASISLAQGNYGASASYGANALASIGAPDIQTSGKHNPNTGALGNSKPYVVLHFPVQSVPGGFSNQYGFPSDVNLPLGSLTGYTEVEKVHLNIPGALQEELSEIQSLLNEGVIL